MISARSPHHTVFRVGSQTYSEASPPRQWSKCLLGTADGPQAEELIGKWAFPFLSPVDGAPASATGAWIAKRGP